MALLLFKVDWTHFSLIAGRIVVKDIIFAFILLLAANFIRALRFYKIDHHGNKLGHWWVVNQVYNLMTATLPGGAGEAATVYLLKKFSAFNIVSAFRILFLTRLMDLTGLSALLLFAALQMGRATPYREVALWTSAVVSIMTIIITHPKSERSIVRLIEKIPVKGRLLDKVCGRFKEIAEISEKRISGVFFGMTILQSVIMIFIAALSVHFVLISFGTGFSYTQSFYCFAVYALFQIIPVQGIAGIGTQAAWWSIALTIAGYKGPDAIAMGILLHGTFYLFIVLMGLSVLLFLPVIKKSALKNV